MSFLGSSSLPPLPRCPECGGDLVVFRHPGGEDLVWACRACGNTYSATPEGKLKQFPMEIFGVDCPECGTAMFAKPAAAWSCPECGTELEF